MRHPLIFRPVALLMTLLLGAGEGVLLAQQPPAAPSADAAEPDEIKLTGDQLDALVAPIALYPDTLLAQCLVASTYPIDVVQAQQWAGEAQESEGRSSPTPPWKEEWDPSVQALVSLPDALKVLSPGRQVDDGSRQRLPGSAVRGHGRRPEDAWEGEGRRQARHERADEGRNQGRGVEAGGRDRVGEPGSRLCAELQPDGRLRSGAYPYPPLYYPPYAGGAWLGFGVGIAVGIGIAGGWGCGCGRGRQQHDQHQQQQQLRQEQQPAEQHQATRATPTGSTTPTSAAARPTGDRSTANKYGGGTRGDSAGNRQSSGSRSGGAGSLGLVIRSRRQRQRQPRRIRRKLELRRRLRRRGRPRRQSEVSGAAAAAAGSREAGAAAAVRPHRAREARRASAVAAGPAAAAGREAAVAADGGAEWQPGERK